MKTWRDLSEKEKNKYKEYCDKKYGKTISFVETGEPMYFDEHGYLINTQIVIELLFFKNEN
jgi:hypothetical protein